MANKIIPKKSSTPSAVPTPAQLEIGEIAFNLADKKIFSKDAGGTVIEMGGGGTAGTAAYTKTTITATGGQTSFSVSYSVGYVDVWLNGAKLSTSEYTASTGSTVVLTTGATAGDIFEAIAWSMNPVFPDAVSGPASATDNALVRYDGTTGKLVQTSDATLGDDGSLTVMRHVGVGGALSAWASGYDAVQVNTVGTLSATSAEVNLAHNTAYLGAGDTYTQNGAASLYRQTGGKHEWYTAPSGTAGNLVFFDDAMFLTNSGDLGLGVVAPSRRAHLRNTTAATNTVTQVLRIDTQSSGTPAIGIGVGMEFAVETASNNTEVGATIEAVTTDVTAGSEDFDLVFRTMAAGAAAAERARISSTGALSVGDAATTRTNLGLGTIATQASSNVSITGGSISGITDLAIADGGTGASDAATARTNLGLAIGTNVQAYDADLAAIAGLAVTDGNFIVGNGTTWVAESGATARTSLGLGTLATQSGTFSGTSSGTNTGDQNIFQNIAVSGQSTVTADTTTDTLTLAAGSGITITTDAATDTVTIAATGGGTGDVVGPASATDNAIVRYDGTTGKLIQNSSVTIADSGSTEINADFATTNSVANALQVNRTTSGTPAAGIGAGLNFGVETLVGSAVNGASISAVATDVSALGSDFDLVFSTMLSSAAVAERFRISSFGGLGVAGANYGIQGDVLTSGGPSAEPSWGGAEYTQSLSANRTLTSTTAAQAIFPAASDALTLPVGTYEYELVMHLSGMSATSGNCSVNILGAGTATIASALSQAFGVDQSTLVAAAASYSAWTGTTSAASVVTAATGTALVLFVNGTFRVSVAGTIVPSIALVTAAAATMNINTHMHVRRISASSTYTTFGPWA